MSRIDNPSQPRFAGYRVDHKERSAKLYLPGHADLASPSDQFTTSKVTAEVIKPGQSKPQPIDLIRQGDYWQSKEPVPLGTDYRFRVNQVDLAELNKLDATPLNKKNAGSSKPDLQEKGNGVWEFDNPLPTAQEKIFTLPQKSSVLPWRLERLAKGEAPVGLPVKSKAGNWVFTDKDSGAENRYRLSPALDLKEVVQHGDYGSFNRVSHLEETSPQKSPMLLDTYQDSQIPIKQLQQLDKERREIKKTTLNDRDAHIPDLPMRNSVNRFAMDPNTGTAEEGLNELIGIGQELGARGLLLKPSIGGDMLSSHGYWTEDPYVLNRTFSSKEAFRDMAGALTGLDTKLIADGAFVNMGLNGVQQAANRTHGLASPYWRWFKYGDENTGNPKKGPETYPAPALGKPVNGVLPVKTDEHGNETLNKDYLGIRVLNDPESRTIPYNGKKPTYIELYDTRLEEPNGDPKPNADPKILKGSDTVQKYQFEINPRELTGKKRDLESMLEWSNFRLGLPSEDKAGAKWDGQIDTALLNTRNPEVVNYLKGAVTYWTRFVMNTNVRNLTQALLNNPENQKLLANGAAIEPNLSKLLKNITQKSNQLDAFKDHKNPQSLLSNKSFKELLKNRPLPPAQNPEEQFDQKELKRIYENIRPDHAEAQNGQAFAKRLLKEVPMNVLPLPTLFKADLAYPGLEQALITANRGKFAQFMSETVLGNLARIPVLGHIFRSIRNFFFPRPFQEQLGDKMQDIFRQLNPESQKKLRYGNVQSLVADKVGEVIYLSLFTGLQPERVNELIQNKDTKKLEEAFYQGMPEHILKSDPVTASKFIPALLSKRLKELSPRQIGNLVAEEVRQLDPHLAAVAKAVLNQRELGLNWRIDAAKDVADMNRIKEAPDYHRAQVFEEEFDYMMNFWGKMTHSIREVFPKTSIIPEMTDLELLSGADKSGEAGKKGKAALRKVQDKLFHGGVFNGMPNMRYMFSSANQVVNYESDPTNFGHSQIDPSQFMDIQREFVESLPSPVARQMQNMVSSHDFATSSHMMLVNPQQFHNDREKSRGLMEDFTVALDELQHKVCFEPEREKLKQEIPNLDDKLQQLQGYMQDPAFKENLTDKELKGYYDKVTKTAPGSPNHRPTPFALKSKFVDEVFKASNNLGLTNENQINALKDELKARIEEPSEAKAMRAVIVNATEDFIRNPQVNGKPLNLSADDAKALRNALWPALNITTAREDKDSNRNYGQHFGYQPLDIALNHVFENLDQKKLAESLGKNGGENGRAKLEAIKLGLYQTPTRQVMDKLQKLFAVQVATPGMPSMYVPDLLAQYGAEWKYNTFLQNRNIYRTDKLAGNSADKDFQKYFGNVKNLTAARTNPQLQALSDGDLLRLTPDDQSGILPIVRDNGKDQVITLVNVGTMPKYETESEKEKREKTGGKQPTQPMDWLHKAGQEGPYTMPERIVKSKTELQQTHYPDLSELRPDAKTMYQDPFTKELFKLDENNRLYNYTAKLKHQPDSGVGVNNWRILVRVNADQINASQKSSATPNHQEAVNEFLDKQFSKNFFQNNAALHQEFTKDVKQQFGIPV